MATIIDTIVKADYMADGRQVETLTHSVVEGIRADSTYLRILVAHVKGRLGAPKRGRPSPQEPVLDKVHSELYPFVLRGVGPEDMEQTERFRLATFARTAASTVRFFIRYGGDVRTLDVATVTKGGLRKAVQGDSEDAGSSSPFSRARESILKQVKALASEAPEEAANEIAALIQELQEIADGIEEQPEETPPPPPAPAKGKGGRVVRLVRGTPAPAH
jgi:hypothetical protein